MQFSFYLPCYWPDTSIHFKVMYDEMLVQAARAEELGYAMLGIPEHHFINYLTHPSPLLTAVKLTSVTKHMPFITSVLARDYGMIMGTTMLFAALIVVANFLVDLTYPLVDPRVRLH